MLKKIFSNLFYKTVETSEPVGLISSKYKSCELILRLQKKGHQFRILFIERYFGLLTWEQQYWFYNLSGHSNLDRFKTFFPEKGKESVGSRWLNFIEPGVFSNTARVEFILESTCPDVIKFKVEHAGEIGSIIYEVANAKHLYESVKCFVSIVEGQETLNEN